MNIQTIYKREYYDKPQTVQIYGNNLTNDKNKLDTVAESILNAIRKCNDVGGNDYILTNTSIIQNENTDNPLNTYKISMIIEKTNASTQTDSKHTTLFFTVDNVENITSYYKSLFGSDYNTNIIRSAIINI